MPPTTGWNLNFFTRTSGKSAKLFSRKLLLRVCCMKPAHAIIISPCWSQRIASSFTSILHDRIFLYLGKLCRLPGCSAGKKSRFRSVVGWCLELATSPIDPIDQSRWIYSKILKRRVSSYLRLSGCSLIVISRECRRRHGRLRRRTRCLVIWVEVWIALLVLRELCGSTRSTLVLITLVKNCVRNVPSLTWGIPHPPPLASIIKNLVSYRKHAK